MSYPYHGQYPDEYSTPSTPRDPFPQWEVLEQHQPQAQGAQMPQHQDIQLNQPSPLTPIQTTPLYAQHLQLDPEPYIPSQDSPLTEHPGGVLLHHVPQLSHHDSSGEAGPSSGRGRSSLRSSPPRTRAQHRMNPYPRPESSADGPSSNTRHRQQEQQRQRQQREQQPLRFIQQLPPPPSTVPARLSLSTPAPSTSLHTASNTPTTTSSRFLAIRVDWRYDPITRKITAYFEMPGIRREDIRISLGTSYYNRVKQVTVYATRRAPFPGAVTSREAVPGREFNYIEGKYGECRRSITVPPDCKLEDIDAQLADGVLVLKINCGPPDDENEVSSIPLR